MEQDPKIFCKIDFKYLVFIYKLIYQKLNWEILTKNLITLKLWKLMKSLGCF